MSVRYGKTTAAELYCNSMRQPIEYGSPDAHEASRRPLWLQQFNTLCYENAITAWCIAGIIVVNGLITVAALMDLDGGPLIFLPLVNFVLVGISVLLTPFVWARSDEICQTDRARVATLIAHILVAILLPYLCYVGSIQLVTLRGLR